MTRTRGDERCDELHEGRFEAVAAAMHAVG